MDSILKQFFPEQIEQAKNSLIEKGLVDDEIQAMRNLEMDLEEREQLALWKRSKLK